MICARCSLSLPPGARHPAAEDCLDALKHALKQALVCAECGEPGTPTHARCLARATAGTVAKGATGLGIASVEKRVFEALARAMLPKGQRGEGEEPRRSRRERRDDEGERDAPDDDRFQP